MSKQPTIGKIKQLTTLTEQERIERIMALRGKYVNQLPPSDQRDKGEIDRLRALNLRLIAERDEAQAFLRQELDDWAVTDTRIRDAAKKVLPLIDVEGDSHCVPSVESIVDGLVAENARLREALAKYADRDNWGERDLGDFEVWNYGGNGWEVAEAALANETPTA